MSAIEELADPAFPPSSSWCARFHTTRLPARYLGYARYTCSECRKEATHIIVCPKRYRGWQAGRGHPFQLCHRCYYAGMLPPLPKTAWTDEEWSEATMAQDNAELPHAIICTQARRAGRGDFSYVHSRYPTAARAEVALEALTDMPALPRTSRRFALATPATLAAAIDFAVVPAARAK